MHLSAAQSLILFLKAVSAGCFYIIMKGVPEEAPSKGQRFLSIALCVFLDHKLHVSFHEILIQVMVKLIHGLVDFYH